jgi:hypothetical protein
VQQEAQTSCSRVTAVTAATALRALRVLPLVHWYCRTGSGTRPLQLGLVALGVLYSVLVLVQLY